MKASFGTSKIDSLINTEGLRLTTDPISNNTYIQLKAIWLPVSFWNFGFILFIMIALFVAMWIGKHFFNVNKWKNSSNTLILQMITNITNYIRQKLDTLPDRRVFHDLVCIPYLSGKSGLRLCQNRNIPRRNYKKSFQSRILQILSQIKI